MLGKPTVPREGNSLENKDHRFEIFEDEADKDSLKIADDQGGKEGDSDSSKDQIRGNTIRSQGHQAIHPRQGEVESCCGY
jgi:hypothetical protein